jgi:hypothetical protein
MNKPECVLPTWVNRGPALSEDGDDYHVLSVLCSSYVMGACFGIVSRVWDNEGVGWGSVNGHGWGHGAGSPHESESRSDSEEAS